MSFKMESQIAILKSHIRESPWSDCAPLNKRFLCTKGKQTNFHGPGNSSFIDISAPLLNTAQFLKAAFACTSVQANVHNRYPYLVLILKCVSHLIICFSYSTTNIRYGPLLELAK